MLGGKKEEKYIFISYAHKDTDRVMPIIKHLKESGISIWYDDGIDPGSEWAENIASHLRGSVGVLAFMSKNYLKSSNCKDELEFARDIDKDRILVYLEEVELSDGMAMRVNRIQAMYMYRYPSVETFVEKILQCAIIQKAQRKEREYGAKFSWEQNTQGYRGSNRYHILEKIEKSLGQVYKAYDMKDKKTVAIKKYRSDYSYYCPIFGRSDLVDDLKSIESPHICKLLEVTRGADPSLVMEFLDGVTLREVINKCAMEPVEVLSIIRQTLMALSLLHEKEIYYGDVTPSNIMLVNERVVLCDFSSVNYIGSKFDDGSTILFVKYRSPEKEMPNMRLDGRSDIYEVGTILDEMTLNLLGNHEQYYECFKNKSPFERDEYLELQLQKKLKEKTYDEDYAVKIFTIIKKALSLERDDRYQSVCEMIEALDSLL